MLELSNVFFSYEDKEVLKDFSLTINDGECVCISGESGCGKTTVLRLISGLEKANRGTVFVDGKVSVVFQEDRLLPWLSLYSNLKLITNKANQDNIDALLKLVGLEEAKMKKPHDLSGGMKRRAAIVRAILNGGDILLLDEPFNGIDLENKKILAGIIENEYLQKGKIVVMVSHIKEDAELLGARIIGM